MDKTDVKEMFDDIAPSYDKLNHLLTFGIDIYWRQRAVRSIHPPAQSILVDMACGTADLSIALCKKHHPSKVVGVDLSPKMLRIGQVKVAQKGLTQQIELQEGNGEAVALPDHYCHAVTIGFGIRNFQHPLQGLKEFYRILEPNGELMVLEFSMPTNRLFGALYRWYFNRILPRIGRFVSKNSDAYTYLPDSVADFAHGPLFCELMQQAGFREISTKPLTFGIATIYTAKK